MSFYSIDKSFKQQFDTAVVVACDRNYLPYAATPALALAAQHGRAFDVLIGGPEPVTLPDSLSRRGIGHVAARDDSLLDALPLDARRSLATYMELFLGAALIQYRRILVIDADILYQGGDPAKLMQADLSGHAVAAIRDNRQWRTPNRKVAEFRALGEPALPYFNAGVVMIDTESFAQQDLPARAAAFARKHLAGLGRDQALLNGLLKGDWAEISPLWNWQFTSASMHLTHMVDPFMIHFIGTRKPWSENAKDVVPMRIRQAFAAVVDEHFPDHPKIADADTRCWSDAGTLRGQLWRQWRAAGPMLRYLRRFSDPYQTLNPIEA